MRDEHIERGQRAFEIGWRKVTTTIHRLDHARSREHFERGLLRFVTGRQKSFAKPVDERGSQFEPVGESGRAVLPQACERVVAGDAQILASLLEQVFAHADDQAVIDSRQLAGFILQFEERVFVAGVAPACGIARYRRDPCGPGIRPCLAE
ncbi:UNVERIFIED_ORG: hypothetical protein J2791_000915 [Burkholderia contaminans]|nr:hypothetical protein [Burkholderia contaminans]